MRRALETRSGVRKKTVKCNARACLMRNATMLITAAVLSHLSLSLFLPFSLPMINTGGCHRAVVRLKARVVANEKKRKEEEKLVKILFLQSLFFFINAFLLDFSSSFLNKLSHLATPGGGFVVTVNYTRHEYQYELGT